MFMRQNKPNQTGIEFFAETLFKVFAFFFVCTKLSNSNIQKDQHHHFTAFINELSNSWQAFTNLNLPSNSPAAIHKALFENKFMLQVS